jgi:endonuclease/exonuclease/phosphatase family metal-dependent hydrolase
LTSSLSRAHPARPESRADSQDARARLRVATYNIHKGVLREFFGLKHIARIHELRARLHELDADLIFLQEVQGRHDRYQHRFEGWPAEQQDVFLARAPGLRPVFESAYGRNATYLHGHHGNALLSRFSIVERAHLDVSDHIFERRGLLRCVVSVGNIRVHCFVVHFGLLAASRKRQAAALSEWIAREVPADEPLIIAGDFNDWRDELSGALCESLGVSEVFGALRPRPVAQQLAHYMAQRLSRLGMQWPQGASRAVRSPRTARTFPALIPWLRMDRIYQRGFRVNHAQVLGGPAWARLSDHSPLIADLELV